MGRVSIRLVVGPVLLLWLAGCCDEQAAAPAEPDATSDVAAAADSDEGGDLGQTGTALTIPDPPVFTPCPPGWREAPPTSPEDVTTCDPWPEGGPMDCPDGQTHFPGEPGCALIGSPCPQAEWADDLPDDGTVLYVRAGEAVGGTGTREAPFGLMSDALSVAEPGTVIALGRGTFEESVVLTEGLILRGACAAETTIAVDGEFSVPESPDELDNAAVVVSGEGVVIRDLRVTGTLPGMLVPSGGAVDLEGVVFDQTTFAALLLIGGRGEARSVLVRGTVGLENDRNLINGAGLLSFMADVELTRAVFERNTGASIQIGGGAATLRDLVVRDTQRFHVPWVDAVGLLVALDAEVAVTQAVFENNPGESLFVANDEELTPNPSALSLSDTVIRGSPTPVSGVIPSGIMARGHDGVVEVELRRVLVDGARGEGLYVGGRGAALTAFDTVVRDTGSYGTDTRADQGGVGLWLTNGGVAELTRVLFLRNAGLSVWVNGNTVNKGAFGTVLSANDLRVETTNPMSCAEAGCTHEVYGIGIAVTGPAVCELTRFSVATSALAGFQLSYGAQVDLHRGQVARNPIGVNVQVEGYDLSRLQDEVLYLDNERNLDSESLPVPDPGAFLDF